jgi:hypothetical protein
LNFNIVPPDGVVICVPASSSVYATLKKTISTSMVDQNDINSLSRTVYIPPHFVTRIVVVSIYLWSFLCLQVLENFFPCMPSIIAHANLSVNHLPVPRLGKSR